jgi:hypothetical protein
MNKLSIDKQAKVISALVEGNSIRATCRMTGIAKNTIVKLLADLGRICAEYQDKIFRNLPCKRIQCDEIWSFCYAKEKNVPTDKKGIFGYGDIWTFNRSQPVCSRSTTLWFTWMPRSRSSAFVLRYPYSGCFLAISNKGFLSPECLSS